MKHSTTERGSATRRRILEAARALLEEGGFRKLRISALCERAGVAPTSVYWHFGSKEALTQTVLEALFEPRSGEIAEIATGRGSARAKIRAFVAQLRALATERPVGSLTTLALLREDDSELARLREPIAAARRRELQSQIKALTESLGVGAQEARGLALTINACLNYAAMVHLAGGSSREVGEILDVVSQALQRAVGRSRT